jgi:hypothetical protein
MKRAVFGNGISRRDLIRIGGVGIAGAVFAPHVARASTGMADTLIFKCHGTGSGNIIATAISDALQKTTPVRIRVSPAANGVALVLPLKMGGGDYTFAANELFFASEAAYEFGTRDWGGPQELRIVLAPPKALALASAKDANIFTPKDLKGKRVGYVKGSPSVNVKTDAYLAFAGLTRDDVEVVWLSNSSSGSKEGLINNQIDAVTYTTNSPAMKEVELSSRGLRWVEFSPDDTEGWARLQAIMPAITPRRDTNGEAMSPEHPVDIMGWKYPQIACYNSRDPDEVYAFIKALDESYDLYKSAHPDIENLHISKAGRTPADVPFHEGAIRYLKEKGVWRDEDQDWQDKRIARIADVRAKWNAGLAAFGPWYEAKKAQGLAEDAAWDEFWEAFRNDKV